MAVVRLVDPLERGGDGGRFSRPSRPRDDDDSSRPAAPIAKELGGDAERVEVGNFVANSAQDGGPCAELVQEVDPETRAFGRGEAAVMVQRRAACSGALPKIVEIGIGDRRGVERSQLAVNSDHCGLAEMQDEIRRPGFYRHAEKFVEQWGIHFCWLEAR